MKNKVKFDELNRLKGDYGDYFEPMAISEDDKARRRELAEMLTDAFLYFFSVYEVHSAYNNLLAKAQYEQMIIDSVSDATSKVSGIDGYMSDHIRTLARQVVDTTFKNADTGANANTKSQVRQVTPQLNSKSNSLPALDSSPDESADSPTLPADSHIGDEDGSGDYWLSMQRATNIAQNEANVLINHSDYTLAKELGHRYKTWHTMLDDKVREEHAALEGATIGIDEVFQVGNSQMLYPCDQTFEPDPAESINCRCSVEYR